MLFLLTMNLLIRAIHDHLQQAASLTRSDSAARSRPRSGRVRKTPDRVKNQFARILPAKSLQRSVARPNATVRPLCESAARDLAQ